ncbi:WD40/YVTN/BNR-like repeat-containing protein [Oleiharenicola lentus]|uniref:WD40/YVTN/BNR-like repeat-containing protein n=1 Tax=Oleiharenicola lentus TaxID=2508720 RepID=UPI003F673684
MKFPALTRLVCALPLMSSLMLTAAPAKAPAGDFYICAGVNKNYVIGSKITTVNGMFRLTDQNTWEHVGYNDTTITAAAIDPRDHNVVYTAAFNGCWRTLDGGKTWRMTTSWDMTEGLSIALDTFAPDNLYLALVDGIAHSSDRAQTWRRFENGLPERGKFTQVIRLDRTRQGRVLAGCESGIYLTENTQWKRVLPTDTTVIDIQQSPHDPKHWFAVTQSNGAWESRDNAVTWTQFKSVSTEHALYSITQDYANPARLAIGSWAHGVLTTEDGGRTWTQRNTGLPASPRVWRVGVEPASNRLYASVRNEDIFSSDDFGRTWKPTGLAGSAVHSFLIVPKLAR